MSEDSRSQNGKVVPLAAKPRRPCPICGRPALKAHRPFCSARCADVDLGRWLSGRYRIATEEVADSEDDDGPPADDRG